MCNCRTITIVWRRHRFPNCFYFKTQFDSCFNFCYNNKRMHHLPRNTICQEASRLLYVFRPSDTSFPRPTRFLYSFKVFKRKEKGVLLTKLFSSCSHPQEGRTFFLCLPGTALFLQLHFKTVQST